MKKLLVIGLVLISAVSALNAQLRLGVEFSVGKAGNYNNKAETKLLRTPLTTTKHRRKVKVIQKWTEPDCTAACKTVGLTFNRTKSVGDGGFAVVSKHLECYCKGSVAK
jgi:hypothetical protein